MFFEQDRHRAYELTFNLRRGDPDSRYHGSEIIFENSTTKEVFEGVVVSHRNEYTLYVRVPALQNSTQRVRMSSIRAVVKLVDHSHSKTKPLTNTAAYTTSTREVNTIMAKAIESHLKNDRYQFLFFPNGEPVAALLNEAARISKKSKEIKHSDVLNSECRKHFNVSYNKMLPKAKKYSPFMVAGHLFLPFVFKPEETGFDSDAILYVTVGKEAVTISENAAISQPKDFLFKGESLALADIEMLQSDTDNKIKNYDDGQQSWLVKPYVVSKGSPTPYLIITKGDEGICADLWVQDGEEDHCVDSTYEYSMELAECANNFKKLEGLDLSASEACKIWGLSEPHDHMDLMTLNGLYVELHSNEGDDPDNPPLFELKTTDDVTVSTFDNLSSDLDDLTFKVALSLAS